MADFDEERRGILVSHHCFPVLLFQRNRVPRRDAADEGSLRRNGDKSFFRYLGIKRDGYLLTGKCYLWSL